MEAVCSYNASTGEVVTERSEVQGHSNHKTSSRSTEAAGDVVSNKQTKPKPKQFSQGWWPTFAAPELGRLKQEDQKFKANLSYVVRLSQLRISSKRKEWHN